MEKTYLVGGAVRAQLMGVAASDFDYVVVGSTEEKMLSKGFKKVGKHFPVFHCPETGNEHALARREKKVGVGYSGFACELSPDVTLGEDLFRRDFTMNSIALCPISRKIIDPFDGITDIKNKVIRHTNSDAFSDDPLRLLRAARFLAQFGDGWVIAPETVELFKKASEEFKHIPKERVWREVDKALHGESPMRFFETLYGFGIVDEVDALKGIPQREDYHPEGCAYTHTKMVVEYASDYFLPKVVFGALCHDLGKSPAYLETGMLRGHETLGVEPVISLCAKLGVPREYKDFAVKCAEFHTSCHKVKDLNRKTIWGIFNAMGVYRDAHPSGFVHLIQVCESDAKGRGAPFDKQVYKQRDLWNHLLTDARNFDRKSCAADLMKRGVSGKGIFEEIRKAQLESIEASKMEYLSLDV